MMFMGVFICACKVKLCYICCFEFFQLLLNPENGLLQMHGVC